MPLTSSLITGRLPLPTGQPLAGVKLTFSLSAWDREGADIVLPAALVVPLDETGALPEGFRLWRNSEGLRGTHYSVTAQWDENDRARGSIPRDVPLGTIQIGAAAEYVLGDLLGNSIPVATSSFWVQASEAVLETILTAASALEGFTAPGYLAATQAAGNTAGSAAAAAASDANRAEIARIASEAAVTSLQGTALTLATWAALSALTSGVVGTGAEVLDTDTGTHTDPVSGLTVPNAGRYSWTGTAWQRIGDTGLSGKASLAELDARVDVSRPRYYRQKQLAAATVDSAMRLLSGSWADGASFVVGQSIGVSNGLVSVAGALRFGDKEGSTPLSGGTIESGRPRYHRRKQILTGDSDARSGILSATYIDGMSYGQQVASEKRPLVVLGDSLANELVAELPGHTGRTIIDLTIAGQRHWQMFGRLVGVTLTTSTNTIASGANSVTHINEVAVAGAANTADHMILSTASDTTTRSIAGTLGSIRGTLTRSVVSTVETYSFTPTAGQALPVTLPAGTSFIPDTLAYLDYPQLWSMGRNGSWTDGKTLDVIQRLMNLVPHRRIIVMEVPNGDLNAPNEYGPSGALYLQIKALNAAIQKIAGPCYVPVSRILKDRGLTLAGLTPNTQDATDTANDVESNQLRADSLHRSTAGRTVIARDIIVPILANWS